MKDFQHWNQQKIIIEDRKTHHINPKRREIWLGYVGENVGNESSKHEPFLRYFLIVNPYFGGNLALVMPLTKTYKPNLQKYFFPLGESFLMIHQIKVISYKRLLRNTDKKINHESFNDLKKRLQKLI